MPNEVEQLKMKVEEMEKRIRMLMFSDRYLFSRDIEMQTGRNFQFSITPNGGTRIGTGTNQLLSFYNNTPIVQPSSTGQTTGFTAGAGTAVNDASTFTGNVGSTAYRISDIVQHLKNLGLIAS